MASNSTTVQYLHLSVLINLFHFYLQILLPFTQDLSAFATLGHPNVSLHA